LKALIRCHGKFVASGKFFPPPYCHNVTNAYPNPNPNPNPRPKFNPILNLTSLILHAAGQARWTIWPSVCCYCVLLCVGIIFQWDEFSTTPALTMGIEYSTSRAELKHNQMNNSVCHTTDH